MSKISVFSLLLLASLVAGLFADHARLRQPIRQISVGKRGLQLSSPAHHDLIEAEGSSQKVVIPTHATVMKQAVRTTILTFLAAGLFWAGIWFSRGPPSALEFITGFLVEKSLSVDNLFVFLMLFDSFRIPEHLQNRVLTWGVIGAISMRGVMIFFGVQAIAKFRWVLLLFSGILLVSSLKMIQESFTSSHGSSEEEESMMMKLTARFLPTSSQLDGEKFITVQNGKRLATPLLACLVCVELSDFIFAVDSIPAVLGVSKDPFIVFSSNVFAILGLRSLYVLLSHAVSSMRYIKPSVAGVLAFVAGKMVAEYYHFEVSSTQSLLVIAVLLATGIGASMIDARGRKANAAFATTNKVR